MKQERCCTKLTEAKPNKEYIIVGIENGHQIAQKLYSMGLNIGSTFKLLNDKN